MNMLTNDLPYSDPTLQSTTPVFVSMYMLDACKNGRLFNLDTYNAGNLILWINNFSKNVTKGIIFPSHFTERSVLKKFGDKIISISRENELIKAFENVDAEDIKSIEEFSEGNKKKGEESLRELENFLRQDEFPPFLWMEFSRFGRVFIETSDFMAERITRWFKLRPKKLSQVRERSKHTQSMLHPYVRLIDSYFKVMLAFLRIYLFMEVWSCEAENELFTKKPWTFKKIEPHLFQPIFLEFHNSISELRKAFFRFKPEKVKIEFDKPTEWAFKQLIQMV